jgi:outer membrane protein OmpA-like peptidoglycan-associated protein
MGRRHLAGAAAFASAALVLVASARAEDVLRKDELVRLLSRNVKAMHIDTGEANAARRSPGLPEPESKTELRRLIPTLPSASVNIGFDYKSSNLNPQAEPALDQIGQALSDPAMRKFRYAVVGHTDAAEGRVDDMPLSEDRAKAVRDYLVKKYAVPPDRIVSIGFGKGRLKEPGNPLSPLNRRVEIINIGE